MKKFISYYIGAFSVFVIAICLSPIISNWMYKKEVFKVDLILGIYIICFGFFSINALVSFHKEKVKIIRKMFKKNV